MNDKVINDIDEKWEDIHLSHKGMGETDDGKNLYSDYQGNYLISVNDKGERAYIDFGEDTEKYKDVDIDNVYRDIIMGDKGFVAVEYITFDDNFEDNLSAPFYGDDELDKEFGYKYSLDNQNQEPKREVLDRVIYKIDDDGKIQRAASYYDISDVEFVDKNTFKIDEDVYKIGNGLTKKITDDFEVGKTDNGNSIYIDDLEVNMYIIDENGKPKEIKFDNLPEELSYFGESNNPYQLTFAGFEAKQNGFVIAKTDTEENASYRLEYDTLKHDERLELQELERRVDVHPHFLDDEDINNLDSFIMRDEIEEPREYSGQIYKITDDGKALYVADCNNINDVKFPTKNLAIIENKCYKIEGDKSREVSVDEMKKQIAATQKAANPAQFVIHKQAQLLK